MTWRTDEDSVHDGAPIMLYSFVGPATTYLYTDHVENYNFGGFPYTAIPISHRRIPSSHAASPGRLELEIGDLSVALVQDWAFSISQYQMSMTMRSLHLDSGDNEVLWTGRGIQLSVAGRRCRVSCPSKLGVVMAQELGVGVMPQCQHAFGDSRCGVVPAVAPGNGWRVDTTVSSVTDEVTIVVSSDGGKADGEFNGGEFRHVPSGERRTIVDHTGNTMTLEWGFPSIGIAESVVLIMPCDRRYATCRDTFSNSSNHGGHAFMPTSNPFANPYGFKGGN